MVYICEFYTDEPKLSSNYDDFLWQQHTVHALQLGCQKVAFATFCDGNCPWMFVIFAVACEV